jgi:hypothetical protein
MKAVVAIIALALPVQAAAGPSKALLDAIWAVESGRGTNPRNGDGGKAVGPLQIHVGVVRDVNRVYGTSYRHADARDLTAAREICRLYLAHYATPARIGRAVTDRDRARIWNGGPDGWRQSCTAEYWSRIRRVMSSRARRRKT